MNHFFNIVNSSLSFQSSLPVSVQGTPTVITLSSNSPTPDIDQHSYQCIGKQTDTTRTYPTLPLKVDPKLVVPPDLFGDHKNGKQLHNWAKKENFKVIKITPVQIQRAHE